MKSPGLEADADGFVQGFGSYEIGSGSGIVDKDVFGGAAQADRHLYSPEGQDAFGGEGLAIE